MIFELGDGKDSAVPICTEVQAEEKYSKSQLTKPVREECIDPQQFQNDKCELIMKNESEEKYQQIQKQHKSFRQKDDKRDYEANNFSSMCPQEKETMQMTKMTGELDKPFRNYFTRILSSCDEERQETQKEQTQSRLDMRILKESPFPYLTKQGLNFTGGFSAEKIVKIVSHFQFQKFLMFRVRLINGLQASVLGDNLFKMQRKTLFEYCQKCLLKGSNISQ